MNTFGERFRVTTFGESHGEAIGCIIDGIPAGLRIDMDFLDLEMQRRRGGQSIYSTPRKEEDKVEIYSGVFEGYSTGAPIGMIIRNSNTKSKDYEEIKNLFRPSHADWTYYHKYGIRDYKGGGRSSARESALRVASGSIAKMLLNEIGINCESGIYSIGNIHAKEIDFSYAKKSEIFTLDKSMEKSQKELIQEARKSQDSIGGSAIIKASGNIPIGLGEPLYKKLDGDIALMMMGLNGVKAVEIGDGMNSSEKFGSQNNDCMDKNGFLSNHSGGILGGISNGEDIYVKVYFKPTPSIFLAQKTLDINYNDTICNLKGRHDPCIAIRGSVVCESMLALILADMLLLNMNSKLEYIKKIYQK